MKTQKLIFTAVAVALLTCSWSSGQPYHVRVNVEFGGYDYGPDFGVVYGDFTYQFTFWLNDIMPSTFPLEGTISNMSAKVICKGTKYLLSGLVQIHMNANGDITAKVVKGWLEPFF